MPKRPKRHFDPNIGAKTQFKPGHPGGPGRPRTAHLMRVVKRVALAVLEEWSARQREKAKVQAARCRVREEPAPTTGHSDAQEVQAMPLRPAVTPSKAEADIRAMEAAIAERDDAEREDVLIGIENAYRAAHVYPPLRTRD